MNSLGRAFNIILAALFLATSGCKTTEEKKAEKKKQATLLRFHVQTNPDETGRTMQVPVYRNKPVVLTVGRDALLDEGFLKKAEVVDADEMGGCAIKVTFDEQGARRLEALTIEFRGLHLAVRGVWTDDRWLAAPLITKRISNGEFIFTPDATREEAERIVEGLQNVIKKLHERYTL